MIVEGILNKPIDSNSFVLYEKGNSSCIVVDPGTSDCIGLLNFFKINNLIPEYVFLTHEHFDHIWGVNKLKESFPCKTVCSKECAEKIVDSKKNMSIFYNQIGFKTFPADILIENIDFNLIWNNLKIEFIVSKGHTEGSICIFVEDKLFSGDTIIKDHKTVVKFPGGNKNNLLNSLDIMFSKFDRKTIYVYPGHGNCFFLNEIAIEQLV
jgi:glyoxylase-like metal-dependent hydrolase (beta-lactamase superfamily II)